MNSHASSVTLPAPPRVSIGLPTYNRSHLLPRAIESVLHQDWSDLELIVSDNASDDATEALCKAFVNRDPRVRYIRQPANVGPHANFLRALSEARGEYFMWLADDDWLHPRYVSACLAWMRDHPDYSLACGRPIHFLGAARLGAGEQVNLAQDSPNRRVFGYFRAVGYNGVFYGLMQRRQLLSVPNRDVLGGDWLLVGSIAFLGKVRTLDDVAIHRSIDGESSDIRQLAARYEAPGLLNLHPHLGIAITALREIGWESPVYKALGPVRRLSLACGCALAIYFRYCLVYPILHARGRLKLRTRGGRALGAQSAAKASKRLQSQDRQRQ